MTDVKNTLGVYVELDSILDTRLVTLHSINPRILIHEEITGRYTKRISDDFISLPAKVFEYHYKNRDKNTLKEAKSTDILDMVRDYIGTTLLEDRKIGGNNDIKLYFNTYPYELQQEEVDILTNFIIGYISCDNVEVIPIFKSDEEVTPAWLNDEVSVMFKYNGTQWIDRHMSNKNLLTEPMMAVTMFLPAKIYGRMLLKKDKYVEFFEEHAKALSLFVNIVYIDMKYYCFNKI